MDAKVGGSIGANASAISLISDEVLQIESFVPEIQAPLLKAGDEAVAVLDAYGSAPFPARVVSVDPAETMRDGVATYRAVLQFADRDERVRPGMTAQVIITTEKKSNVIAVPQGVVIYRDAKKLVRVREGEDTTEHEVQTGSISSRGTIEITAGLKDGDVVVLVEEE